MSNSPDRGEGSSQPFEPLPQNTISQSSTSQSLTQAVREGDAAPHSSDTLESDPGENPDDLTRTTSFVRETLRSPEPLPAPGQVRFAETVEVIEVIQDLGDNPDEAQPVPHGVEGLPVNSEQKAQRKGILKNSRYSSSEVSVPSLPLDSQPEQLSAISLSVPLPPFTEHDTPTGSPFVPSSSRSSPSAPVFLNITPPSSPPSNLPRPLLPSPSSSSSSSFGYAPVTPPSPLYSYPTGPQPVPISDSGQSNSIPFRSLLFQQYTPHQTPFDGHTTLESNPDWDVLAEYLSYHDESKVRSCDKNLDNLLVFTGLFSAIVAAFTIESYQTLQPDPTDTIVALLTRISLQIDQTDLQSTNETLSPIFNASAGDVGINILWFASLVLSLIIASLAIFVKQWLREYLIWDCFSATERIRVRHVRYQGLLRWRVFEIAGFLPFLLQVSLLSFLIGLSNFLRSLNLVVGWCITGLIVLWIAIFSSTLVTPMFVPDCPYKIPLLSHGTRRIHRSIANLRSRFGSKWQFRAANRYYTYPGDERGIRRDGTIDVDALVSADATLADDSMLEKVICNCAQALSLENVVIFSRKILARYLDMQVVTLATRKLDFGFVPSHALNALIGMICTVISSNDQIEALKTITHSSSPLLELVSFMYRLCNHVIERRRTDYLSNWRQATRVLHQIPIVLIRMDSEEGIMALLKIAISAPLMPITAPAVVPVDQIKKFVHSATSMILQQDPELHPLSLMRAVFDYIAAVQPQDLEKCREEIISFCDSATASLAGNESGLLKSSVASRTTTHAAITSVSSNSIDTALEARRTSEAMTRMNQVNSGIIPDEVIDLCRYVLSLMAVPGTTSTKDDPGLACFVYHTSRHTKYEIV
ncbi:unnamed protein product [Somion occarium]|uniref:DUF6535 domain-containing protein n=1 Tax=Somion occarium TaxID=3059160 RepID=A0ABP1DK21_9APHY